MATLQQPLCPTCWESFPGITMASGSVECVRCHKDNKTPKLYSASNNMHPGVVPSQLQVSVNIKYSIINTYSIGFDTS